MRSRSFQDVAIAGLGYDLPPAVLSSAAIEDRLAPVYERLGLQPGRLELMSGIRERRFWTQPTPPSLASTRAGAAALSHAGLDPTKVGLLIHASVCRDFLEPATASVVHRALGLSPEAAFFDLSNACLGVASAMMMAAPLIESGALESALIVAGENGQGLVDATVARLLAQPELTRKSIKTDFASLTIGSGGAAVLLAHRSLAPSAPRFLGGIMRSATEHNGLCRGGSMGHQDTGVGQESELFMETDAEALLHAGIELARSLWAEFAPAFGFRDQVPDRTITHQVGRAHTRALYETLGLPEASGFYTYPELGNVGSVSLPITLARAAEAGFIEPGQSVALLGIGSGLSAAMMRVEW